MRSIYQLLYRLLYNELAWGYDAVSWAVSLGRWDSWRRAALPFVRGNRILEVGFGTGALLPALQDETRRVVGIEPSAAMQRITSARLRRQANPVPRVQGTAQHLPFADAAFDTIVSAFPAPYILDPCTHREFARCLRPGGRTVIVELVLAGSGLLLKLLYRLVFPSTPDTFQRLDEAAHTAGLSSEEHVVGDGSVRPLVIVAEKKAAG
ncbi:MAG: class I SAM-dependent methyltransferase [Caldilineaceae bacterium SB0661_bin_32]|uniref:Class I SAM-dependent methyltransferase n=1 Tax=Caldilineaceae bacterium SB0661_bin_32 TaxID=2605255 RepID=A0A6B1D3C4_9CHLR|nr:class I SAM-dependent methyltransferase [Caldilineaceae bacterium SB0661_bin_32]